MTQSTAITQTNSKSADILRQVLVLLAAIATIVFNYISQTIPIGGNTSSDISNRYPTYFTPASYAFSIWGFIYLLVSCYAIYQMLPAQRANPNARKIGWLFILTCVLNCLWITLFQYNQIFLSVIVIVAFLLTLIAIYLRLDIGRAEVSRADRWLLHLPFSVYMGWLSVATIANIALFGVAQQWGDLFGIAAPTWAAIMIVVATVIGLILAITRHDIGFVLVLVWAFIAIINKQAGTPVVTTTAWISVMALVIVSVASLMLNTRRTQTLVTSRT